MAAKQQQKGSKPTASEKLLRISVSLSKDQHSQLHRDATAAGVSLGDLLKMSYFLLTNKTKQSNHG